MGWFDSDSLGFWDVALPFYGATHLAAVGGKKVVDAAKGSDPFGGNAGTPPAYNPDPRNFGYGLGPYIDAQGVNHVGEELANIDKKLQDLERLRQEALARGDTVKADDFARGIERVKGERADAAGRGQDNYAAQRTRETIAKQQGLANVAQGALTQDAPQMAGVTSNGQQYLDNADAGRADQFRQLQALEAFANQAEGPSAAQAQLRQGADTAMRQQLSLARSTPGGGGASMRNAAFNAAGITGNAANQAAMLRAQETQAHRQQQLAALDRAAGTAGALRSGDQSYGGMRAGQANTDAGLALTTQQQNLNAELQNRAIGSNLYLGATGLSQQYDAQRDAQAINQSQVGTNYEGARAASAGQQFQAQQAAQAQSNRREDQLIGAGTAALGYAAMASDERVKESVRREEALAKALETVGNAPGYSYEYKDPSQPGAKPGRQYGPMAQDLERGPLGDTLVTDTPNGKMVDTGRVAMMGASAITELNHRLEALERALGKKAA